MKDDGSLWTNLNIFLLQLGFYNRKKKKLHTLTVLQKESRKLKVAYKGSTKAKQGRGSVVADDKECH